MQAVKEEPRALLPGEMSPGSWPKVTYPGLKLLSEKALALRGHRAYG